MKTRVVVATLSLGVLLGLAACAQHEDALSSAGGLPEDRLPYTFRGESLAPTAAKSTDAKLKRGWQKMASEGEQPSSQGDTASGVKLPFPHTIPQ